MINRYRIATNRILETMIQIEKSQHARLEALKSYQDLSLKLDKPSKGRAYYSAAKRTSAGKSRKYKYLGTASNETVRYVKEARHLQKSLDVLGKNIKLLRRVASELEDFDSASIDRNLPLTYRNALLKQDPSVDQRAVMWKENAEKYKATFSPFHPEELIHKTDDGTYVRSKSEQNIYNLLLRLGVTFVYEMPVRTKTKTRFPDFAILSEVDYETVILIEHQGMMNNDGYKERFNDRVYDYLRAGFISGINIFYTFDSINGDLNTDPILDIIDLKIRPRYAVNGT